MKLQELPNNEKKIVAFRVKSSDSDGFKNFTEVATVVKTKRPMVIGTSHPREILAEVFLVTPLAKNGREVWRGDAARGIPGYDRKWSDPLPSWDVEVGEYAPLMWDEQEALRHHEEVARFRGQTTHD